MIRAVIPSSSIKASIPRESGDDPGGFLSLPPSARVFPARAGMIPNMGLPFT